jgi:hypothetical protein
MTVVVLATILSLIALITGIAAVGKGSNWKFTPKDIMKGRRNAIIYVWVTFSTIFSLFHTAANFGYILDPVWGIGPGIQMWFWLHAAVGLLLTGAHAIIHFTLIRDNLLETYFWGDGQP